MTIDEFSQYLSQLESTTSRNEMTLILADLLKKLKSQEAKKAVYLSLGQLAPNYQGIEFKMAEKMMLKALAIAFDIAEDKVKNLFKKTGDLGSLAQDLAESFKGKRETLSINQVYDALLELSQLEGPGSQEKKLNQMAELLRKLSPLACRFVVRIPVSSLRLGFSDMTILDALSFMEIGTKALRPEIERAFNVSADIGRVVEVFKEKGVEGVKKIKLTPGIPLRMSAAERVGSVQEIMEKLEGKAIVEPKYDGLRLQIHLSQTNSKSQIPESKKIPKLKSKLQDKKAVKIFSRNLENVTQMFPDVVKATQKLKIESIVFEGEAVGYNPTTKKFLPFQETMQRKRKYDIELFARDIPLKVFVFDLLYLDGQEIYKLSFEQRRKKLEEIFPTPETDSLLVRTKANQVSSPQEIENLFQDYVKEGLEGVLVKKIDAPYEAGARGFHWIKFKKAMKSELADTVDAILMGYYVGKGKRSHFGIGAFLVGVPDEEGKIKTIAKIGTGPTDEEWQEIKKKADQVRTKNKPSEYEVDKNIEPDIWTEPKLVMEISADEITKSPVHTAAKEKFGQGLALRFPRFLRFREDKSPDQATSEKELILLFQKQRV